MCNAQEDRHSIKMPYVVELIYIRVFGVFFSVEFKRIIQTNENKKRRMFFLLLFCLLFLLLLWSKR
jgi:protein-S-isoprenylcysteine O-methyltransferase Ste14